jgi:BMFP domain-containing protein YqiC
MEIVQISKDKLAKLEEENKILRDLVAALTTKVTELEARLNKSSRNSNQPPSQDGPGKKTIKNSRKKSGKTSGGQLGHEGKTKDLTPAPDKIVELVPKTECECGGDIVTDLDAHTKRQVTDIEPVKVITVEYRSYEGECAQCGQIHKAGFPQLVEGIASYGGHLSGLITYLTTYQLLPLKRTTELVNDIFGIKMSQGTVVNSLLKAHANLEEPEERTKEEIIESDVAQFDESGMNVNGKNYWLHSASTHTSTVYMIHKKRGKEAMDHMGILPEFRGTAVHDHWKSYYSYTLCSHAECNAHHIRHLIYLHEDLGAEWADEMIALLLRIKEHIDLSRLFGADSLSRTDIEDYERIYRKILNDAALGAEGLHIEIQRMIRRMTKYEQETLLFMYDFAVPFTNN